MLFSNIVLLSSSFLYLIQYTEQATESTEPTTEKRFMRLLRREEESETVYNNDTLQTAVSNASINVGIILLMMTVLSFLNRPVADPEVKLRVQNRYIRLAPRVLGAIACLTLWIAQLSATTCLSYLLLICWVVLLWEWNAGKVEGGAFLERRNHDREGHERP